MSVLYNRESEILLDLILAVPLLGAGDLAKIVGRTKAWVTMMTKTDVFQEELAKRRAACADAITDSALRDVGFTHAGKAGESAELAAGVDELTLRRARARYARLRRSMFGEDTEGCKNVG